MNLSYFKKDGRWFYCLSRLGLAIIYFFAAVPKFFSVGLFKATLLAYYGFLPDNIAALMAIAIPWGEFGLALLLVLDEKRQVVYAVLLSLLSSFYVVNSLIFLNHWMPYGCGCFGFGEAGILGMGGVVRNVLIMAVSLVAFVGAKNGKTNWRKY